MQILYPNAFYVARAHTYRVEDPITYEWVIAYSDGTKRAVYSEGADLDLTELGLCTATITVSAPNVASVTQTYYIDLK